jgi:uncharacterized protein (TIGR03083 family)
MLAEHHGGGLLGDEELLAILAEEGARFLRSARSQDLAAPVPNCPGWTLRDLVAHLGLVHRWVTRVVREERRTGPDRVELRSLEDPDPADGAGLLERAHAAHAELVRALETAEPDLACWTVWPATSPRSFWIRRQAFETLVHRVDAQNAAAARPDDGTGLAPLVAADGVDEMVCGFIHRYADHLRTEEATTIGLHAADTGGRWWIRLGTGAPTSGRGRGPAASAERHAEVEGTAGELFLLLWNRRSLSGLRVSGERAAFEAWRRGAHR